MAYLNKIKKERLGKENKIIYLPDLTHLQDGTTRDYTAENIQFIREQQNKSEEIQKTLQPVEQKEIIKKKRKKYYVDWSNYNIYQTREKAMCYRLLNDVIDSIQIQTLSKNGRPTVDIKEIIKCLCVKIYNNISSRRIYSELILFRGQGYLKNDYHFNTICKYLADPRITLILAQIAKELAEPLKSLEHFFAMDSTGFSASDKAKWSKIRLNFETHKDYKKLHMVCGVKTNVIAAVKVSDGNKADSPYFKPLLEDTSKMFTIKEISADAGYLSRDNCDTAKELGAVPYIMPKKNSKVISRGSTAWAKMMRLWKENEPNFRAHYHRRSMSECTFSMIKRKFGDCLRGRLDTTKENEIMCKVVCHNLTVLADCIISFGIKPNF